MSSPTKAFLRRKGRESSSVLEARCLGTWHWSPGGFLESSWSLVYIGVLKKFDLILFTVNRMDELVSKREGKQIKVKFLLLHLFIWDATR